MIYDLINYPIEERMKNIRLLLFLVFIVQSCENSAQKITVNGAQKTLEAGNRQVQKDSGYVKMETDEERIKDEEIAGSLSSKFDDDTIPDHFKIVKNEDEIVQSFLSANLSAIKREVNINILNNSVLYNREGVDYWTFFKFINNKILEIRVEYPDQTSVPNISGERKDLVERIKYRFNVENRRIQIIGYDLSYRKDAFFITKSINFITGKYIVRRKEKGNKDVVTDGWSAEFENKIYSEDWNLPILRDKIFWVGNDMEPS